MIEFLQMMMAPVAVVVILLVVICLLGRPLLSRYLNEDDEPEALAQANREFEKRPRLGAPGGMP